VAGGVPLIPWVDGKRWATAGLVPGYHRGHREHGGGRGFLVSREPSGIDRATRWRAVATTEGAGQRKPRGKATGAGFLPLPSVLSVPSVVKQQRGPRE